MLIRVEGIGYIASVRRISWFISGRRNLCWHARMMRVLQVTRFQHRWGVCTPGDEQIIGYAVFVYADRMRLNDYSTKGSIVHPKKLFIGVRF